MTAQPRRVNEQSGDSPPDDAPRTPEGPSGVLPPSATGTSGFHAALPQRRPRRGPSHGTAPRHSLADRARHRLRRHRDEPAVRAPAMLHVQGVRHRADDGECLRRAVADRLAARARRGGQVHRVHHARRQPRRGRHPRPDGAHSPAGTPRSRLEAPLPARSRSRCSAPHCSTATASSRRRSPCSAPSKASRS